MEEYLVAGDWARYKVHPTMYPLKVYGVAHLICGSFAWLACEERHAMVPPRSVNMLELEAADAPSLIPA